MSEEIRALLVDEEDNPKLADLLEAAGPKCACETATLGSGSPGPVKSSEFLHRIISSPRDYDPVTDKIAEAPFRKAFKNGLSVWRERGPDEDVLVLMEESLWSSTADDPPRLIHGILEAAAVDVRKIEDISGERCFCIYDQTVSRIEPQASPVPTHAGIFGRLPPPGTPNRGIIQKDLAGRLRELFEKRFEHAISYRNGICNDLNDRSKNGNFIDRDHLYFPIWINERRDN